MLFGLSYMEGDDYSRGGYFWTPFLVGIDHWQRLRSVGQLAHVREPVGLSRVGGGDRSVVCILRWKRWRFLLVLDPRWVMMSQTSRICLSQTRKGPDRIIFAQCLLYLIEIFCLIPYSHGSDKKLLIPRLRVLKGTCDTNESFSGQPVLVCDSGSLRRLRAGPVGSCTCRIKGSSRERAMVRLQLHGAFAGLGPEHGSRAAGSFRTGQCTNREPGGSNYP